MMCMLVACMLYLNLVGCTWVTGEMLDCFLCPWCLSCAVLQSSLDLTWSQSLRLTLSWTTSRTCPLVSNLGFWTRTTVLASSDWHRIHSFQLMSSWAWHVSCSPQCSSPMNITRTNSKQNPHCYTKAHSPTPVNDMLVCALIILITPIDLSLCLAVSFQYYHTENACMLKDSPKWKNWTPVDTQNIHYVALLLYTGYNVAVRFAQASL